MINPFKPGDTVTAIRPEHMAEALRGEIVVKDVSDKLIKFSCDWIHYSFFKLVKPGMVSRMEEAKLTRGHVQRMTMDELKKALPMPEKDPSGIDQHTPGAKLDHGKPLAGCLMGFSRALEAVVGVATYGAEKYTRNGWEQVDNGSQRYYDAFMRHLLASGREEIDPRTGLNHLDQAAWNLLAHRELVLRTSSDGIPTH